MNNKNLIVKALKKINAIEINLEISVLNVKQTKLKMKEIKNAKCTPQALTKSKVGGGGPDPFNT